MNRRTKALQIFCTLACMVVSFSGKSNGAPVSSDEPADRTAPVVADSTPGSSTPLVAQVGYLEDRKDVKTGENAGVPSSDAANGILVPVVSVVNPQDSAAKAPNPLVALLPAPPQTKLSSDAEKPPVITTLPIVPIFDQAESAPKPEQIRSPRDALTRTPRSTSLSHNADSSETMDVAEDIVFRPLFRIRQNAPRNSPYSANNLRRQNALRRYNVNGYYRLPYQQPRYTNYNSDYDNDS
ncbi:uncharacterized protein [Venturia canescens]|uniref:uncharacterized protein n=1 Tax=Venturia canescens TaxID=32260 RepID=UPI001C9BD632|nr:uncharacterized protein LOC122415366 [Venturia canescens]